MTPGPKPEPPAIRLEQVEDLSPAEQQGFLRLVRRRLIAQYPDGSRSLPFVYDEGGARIRVQNLPAAQTPAADPAQAAADPAQAAAVPEPQPAAG